MRSGPPAADEQSCASPARENQLSSPLVGEDEDQPQGRAAGVDGGDATRITHDGNSDPSQRMNLAPTMVFPGDVLADRYRVIEELGKGGMGEVHLAEHVAIGRRVAIKTLRGDFHERPDVARRFLQEARTASQLRHPNIVDITDFGHTDRGAPFFVMELLEGEDLKALLKRARTLPWPRIVHIAAQICAALAAAHARGVIHRDMKPDNVFLVGEPGEDHVKILDFGIAKSTAGGEEVGEATRTGMLLGTPHYMSPEQAQDDPLDGRSDVYAMGVLLFRMTTGRLPFRGKSFMKVLGQQMSEAPPRPSEVGPPGTILPEHEAIILRCLEKRPEDRYQSAEALAAALRATLEVPAPPVMPTAAEAIASAPAGRSAPSPRRWVALVGAVIGLGGLGVIAIIGIIAISRPPSASPQAPVEPPIAADQPVSGDSNPAVELTAASPLAGSTGGAALDPVEAPAAAATTADGTTTTGDPTTTTTTTGTTTDDVDAEAPAPRTKKVKKATTAKIEPKPALSSADLSGAAASVQGALGGCPDGLPGMVVKVDVSVSAAGKVTRAEARKPQRGSALGKCVEQAAMKARFPALLSAQEATLLLRFP